MRKKMSAILVGVMLMLASVSAKAELTPTGSWSDLQAFLNLSYFPGSETVTGTLNFTGSWQYTAIGAESGNYNLIETEGTNAYGASNPGNVTFSTSNLTNWGTWQVINFDVGNLYFEDTNGPYAVPLDPFSATTTPGYKIYQLDSDSAVLSYLIGNSSLTLRAGTYIVGFNDNSSTDANDRDYDDIIIAMTPSAVPIPAPIWLLASGLIGLVGLRRRFKK